MKLAGIAIAALLISASAQAKISCTSASGKTTVQIYSQTQNNADIATEIIGVRASVLDMNWVTQSLRASLGEETEAATFGNARVWESYRNIPNGDIKVTLKEDIYDVVEFRSIQSTFNDEGEGNYAFQAKMNIKFQYFETNYPGYNKNYTDILLNCTDNSGENDLPTSSGEL